MKAICENELLIDCTGYKAIDTGVVLLGGGENDGEETVVGYVPNERLHYVLPDDVIEREYERLGLSAPDVATEAVLAERLEAFAADVDALAETLDESVTAMVERGEGAEADEDVREQLRTLDRLLERVRRRAEQFDRLAAVQESEREPATGEGGSTARATGDVADRVARLERQVDDLALAAGASEAAIGAGTAGTAEAMEGTSDETAASEEQDEGDLEAIDGLGETYLGRLRAARVETADDLLEHDPKEIAEISHASMRRVASWIEQAAEMVDDGE